MSRRLSVVLLVAGVVTVAAITGLVVAQTPATQPAGAPVAAPSNSGASAIFAAPASTQAAVNPEKDQAIRKLMDLTGAGKIGQMVAAEMFRQASQNLPTVPAEFWAEAAREIQPERLTDALVPIYDRHLTLDEVRDLIKFYESPTGKKLIAVQPAIARETAQASQAWFQQAAQQTVQKLHAKGYELPQGPGGPGGAAPGGGAAVPGPAPH